MNNAGSPYPAPLTLPLLDAITASGNTVLGFYRRYLGAAMGYLVFDRRVRGITARLSPTDEAAIASALIAAGAPTPPAGTPAQASFVTWSNGDGWRTSEPPFNEFPLPYVPVVAPSSMTLPEGSTGRPYESFVQSPASATWTIDHNLAGDPSVNAFNQDYEPIQGEVTYWTGLVVIVFPAPIAGVAYLV